jgi:hypothetical protein
MANVSRRRVTLKDLTPLKGNDGSWYTVPDTIVECWATREQLNSNSGYNQFAQSYATSYKYEIWYNSGVVINSNMTLTDDGDQYKISSITLTGDKKIKWVLICNIKNG